jgi:hypothetical protein
MKTLRSSAPPSSILCPQRAYRNAACTDIRATFERIRAEQAAQAASNVATLRKVKS